MTEEVLTLAEAAQLLKVSEEGLRRLAVAGKVPGAFKVGDLWRFRRQELVKNSPQAH